MNKSSPALAPALILIPMLVLAMAKMPYGYYQILRFVSCTAFVYLLICAIGSKRNVLAIVCSLFAFLYNPIVPVHFGKDTWVAINIVTGILLAVLVFVFKNTKTSLDKKGS